VTISRRALTAALAVALLAGAGRAAAEPPPPTSGAAAIVVDARSGDVMHALRARQERPIASATKLMTALLTLERAELDGVFRAAPYAAAPVESQIGLTAGERMTVRDLLTALLLESANDAAVTLATRIAGSRAAFVREMNRRAVELGLRETSYANPIGFDDPGNHSSARDLARLTRRLLADRRFARIVDMPRATLTSGARVRTIDNRNRLVARHPFVSGVKTGHTAGAGYVLVGSGSARGARVITVTLGAPSEAARDADTLALLRWGLEQFRRERVVHSRRALARIDVRWRDDDAAVGADEAVTVLVRRGERATVALEAPDELEGPLPIGSRVGWVEVRRDGRRARRVPLVTLEAVEGAGLVRRLTEALGAPLTAVLLVGIVLAAMLAIGRRRAR
jgi:D-alanyl-D-alanine carboxypeptidase (penicillin-binding protein 5/6)